MLKEAVDRAAPGLARSNIESSDAVQWQDENQPSNILPVQTDTFRIDSRDCDNRLRGNNVQMRFEVGTESSSPFHLGHIEYCGVSTSLARGAATTTSLFASNPSFTSVRTPSQSAPNSPQSCSAESDAASMSSSSNSEYSSPPFGAPRKSSIPSVAQSLPDDDSTNEDVSLLTKGFTELKSPRAAAATGAAQSQRMSLSPFFGSRSTSCTLPQICSVASVDESRQMSPHRSVDSKVARRRSEDRNVHHGRPTTAPSPERYMPFGSQPMLVEGENESECGSADGSPVLFINANSPNQGKGMHGSPSTGSSYSGGGFGSSAKIRPPPMINTALPPKVALEQGSVSEDSNTGSSGSASSLSSPLGFASPGSSFGSELGRESSGCVSGNSSCNSNSLKRRRPGLRADLQLTLDTSDCGLSEGLGSDLETPRYRYPHEKDDEAVSCVLPWLYLGSLQGLMKSSDSSNIKEFTGFINASRESIPNAPENAKELSLYLRDKPSQDISSVFLAAIQFIEEIRAENGKVLVFCQRGISRSATIVLAYLMWKDKIPYEDALAILKQKRSRVNPNVGFCLQLMSWANLRPSVLSPTKSLVYRIAASDGRSWVQRRAPPEDGGQERNSQGKDFQHELALACGPVLDITSEMFSNPEGSYSPPPTSFQSPGSWSTCQSEYEVATKATNGRCWLICALPFHVQYIWYETSTPGWLVSAAKIVAKQMANLENAPSTVSLVKCGDEPESFWKAITSARSEEAHF